MCRQAVITMYTCSLKHCLSPSFRFCSWVGQLPMGDKYVIKKGIVLLRYMIHFRSFTFLVKFFFEKCTLAEIESKKPRVRRDLS